MCVAVTIEPGAELSLEEIYKMGMANGDGVGFAWADGAAVNWLKAIKYNPKKVVELINSHAHEFRLLHFRLSTVGGVRAELCHPFEIGPKADFRPAGSGSKVLIHNGHWRRWDDIFDIYKKEELLPDKGPWSDTRFAALCASWNEDWIDTMDGKFAVMDYEGNTKYWGSWDQLRPGIKVSNTYWQNHNYDYKRSGTQRSWLGWGWTEYEWKEFERHQSDAMKARIEAEEKLNVKEEVADAKEGAKSSGKEEKKASGDDSKSRLGNGSGKREIYDPATRTWRDLGTGHGGGNGEGEHVQLATGSQGIVQSGGVINGEKQEEQAERQARYDTESVALWVKGKDGAVATFDHRPWGNKANGKWYWIPWDCERSQRSRVEQLSETRARRLLEQIAAALDEREKGTGREDGNVGA